MLGEWRIVKTNELRKNTGGTHTHTHPALMFIIEFLHTATPTGRAIELFIYPLSDLTLRNSQTSKQFG